MKIDGISAAPGLDISKLDMPFDGIKGTSAYSGSDSGFAAPDIDMDSLLNNAVNAVDAPQQELTTKIGNFLQGKEELHNVMIAAEQARFTMNFTVKVRDKIIDAYQTIMRMQV
jgi:flagellar hook-basal body complex protein FliE